MATSFQYLGNLDSVLLIGHSDVPLMSLTSRNSAGDNVISLVVDNNQYCFLETKHSALCGK